MDPNIFYQNRLVNAAEDHGNPLFVTNMNPLRCQNTNCSNQLKGPIGQCLSGHLFCFNCHHGHLNCMLCPENNKLYTAPSMDAIMVVCPNKIRGCNEKFPFYEKSSHTETLCKYSRLMCPIPGCSNRFGEAMQLSKHLTTNHSSNVKFFTFGDATPFAFNKKGETRILIESLTQDVFVVHYAYGCTATIVKCFCVNFPDVVQFKYKIAKRRNINSDLLADTPVPITTFQEGFRAIDSIELLHELRTGKSDNKLHCQIVISIDRILL